MLWVGEITVRGYDPIDSQFAGTRCYIVRVKSPASPLLHLCLVYRLSPTLAAWSLVCSAVTKNPSPFGRGNVQV